MKAATSVGPAPPAPSSHPLWRTEQPEPHFFYTPPHPHPPPSTTLTLSQEISSPLVILQHSMSCRCHVLSERSLIRFHGAAYFNLKARVEYITVADRQKHSEFVCVNGALWLKRCQNLLLDTWCPTSSKKQSTVCSDCRYQHEDIMRATTLITECKWMKWWHKQFLCSAHDRRVMCSHWAAVALEFTVEITEV